MPSAGVPLFTMEPLVVHTVAYVNDKETTGLTDNNKFVALCECGVKATVTENTAKNLRQALQDAKTNGIPVVHITAPYWQDSNKNGIHTDLLEDGTGAINFN